MLKQYGFVMFLITNKLFTNISGKEALHHDLGRYIIENKKIEN